MNPGKNLSNNTEQELRNRILLRYGRTVAGRSDCPELIRDRILQRIILEELEKSSN